MSLCLRGDLVAQHQQLTRQLAGASTVVESLGSRSAASAIAEQICAVEQQMRDAILQGPTGQQLALNPQIRKMITDRLSMAYQDAANSGYTPAVLCDPAVRPFIKPMMESMLPTLSVISFNEVHPKFKVQSVGNVSMSVTAAS